MHTHSRVLNEMFQKYCQYADKHISCFLNNQIVHSSWISFAIKARHCVCQYAMESRLQLAGGVGLGVRTTLTAPYAATHLFLKCCALDSSGGTSDESSSPCLPQFPGHCTSMPVAASPHTVQESTAVLTVCVLIRAASVSPSRQAGRDKM